MDYMLDALIIIGTIACVIAIRNGVKHLCQNYIRRNNSSKL